MPHATKANKYRIGDFARYLGVTRDFLKHYEDSNLLAPYRSDSGYRYFAFDQAPLILESMRLRSYGVTLRQMEEFFNAKDSDETFKCLDTHTDEIEKRILRDTALLEEHRALNRWRQARHGKTFDWEVRESEGFYFLPHSNMLSFLEDERIYEILPAWTAAFPIVKSAVRFSASEKSDDEKNFCWGFAITKEHARRFNLPINDVVQYVPPVRSFFYHMVGVEKNYVYSLLRNTEHPLYDTLRQCGLVPQADGFCLVRLSVQRANVQARRDYVSVVIPLT